MATLINEFVMTLCKLFDFALNECVMGTPTLIRIFYVHVVNNKNPPNTYSKLKFFWLCLKIKSG